MIVSINPTYFCNFRCDFCYLTSEQLGNQKQISLNKLDELLAQVPDIEHIDLYGGEVGAMKKSYFYGLKEVIRKYYSGTININTNYSMMHDGFFDDDVYLAVYDDESSTDCCSYSCITTSFKDECKRNDKIIEYVWCC